MAVQEHFEGFDHEREEVSRSAHKREAQRVRALAEDIANLGDLAFKSISFEDDFIKEAFVTARSLKKTSDERRRQLQYAAKLLRESEYEDLFTQINNLGATAKEDPNIMRLEIWREYLLLAGIDGVNDFCQRIENSDRNKIRHLVKKAVDDIKNDVADKVNVRTLYKYIKSEAKRAKIEIPDFKDKVKELKAKSED